MDESFGVVFPAMIYMRVAFQGDMVLLSTVNGIMLVLIELIC